MRLKIGDGSDANCDTLENQMPTLQYTVAEALLPKYGISTQPEAEAG